MKKSMVMASVIVLMTLMASLSCFADVTGVADTSKEGSLLVWPLIQTNGDNETYIVITNSTAGSKISDDTDMMVNIKCYWEARAFPYDHSGDYCPLNDMIFQLSLKNPLIFKASDGTNLDGVGFVPGIGKDMKGMLKCWAVSPSDINQISWNHLSGYAIIVEPDSQDPPPLTSAWKYSAWRFAANVILDNNGTEFADGFWVGKTIEGGARFNEMKLWGANRVVSSSTDCPSGTRAIQMGASTYYCIQKVNGDKCPWPYGNGDGNYTKDPCYKAAAVYDACPQYLLFEFLAEPTPGAEPADGHANSYLALAPCNQDLRGDDDAAGAFDFATRLVFSIWNSNEVKYTGTYSCPHCNGPPGSTYDIYLKDLKAGGKMNYFQEQYLHTNSGRFRVEGLGGNICPQAKKTPLVGIMASRLTDPASLDIVATGGTGAGVAYNTYNGKNSNPANIRWDPSGAVYEKKKR